MDTKKIVLVAGWFLVFYCYQVNCLTEAQLASTGKLLRNMCQPKHKATSEQIDNFHKRVFNEDKNLMCYMHCVFGMAKLLKKDRFSPEDAAAQIPTLPKKYQEPAKKSLEHCKESGVSSDKCEAVYQVAKCMIVFDMEYYFLP